MSIFDWIVLSGTIIFIVIYGSWKTRKSKNIEGYLLGDKEMGWGTIGISVMATQASAITFLSTPGQAYEDGMRFVQFYFGLPIALVLISATVIPIYYRLKVYTAYEYLENRFDLKTRLLAAFLFLIQRGLAAGITIYAPAIILSTILNWNLNFITIIVGILVIIYTVSGGTKAVSLTQKYQMAVIMTGMIIAFFILISYLPEFMSFGNAVKVAGKMGKLNAVDFSFDINNRYTFWSGITGGLFLAMSYFGTDQSQVQRYISGRSVYESRMGLMFNALLKIPMQLFILFVGVMVFVFYQFEQPPVFFNKTAIQSTYQTEYAAELKKLDDTHTAIFSEKKEELELMIKAINREDKESVNKIAANINRLEMRTNEVRMQVKEVLKKADPGIETKDIDYVFLTFVIDYLPTGIIGLLLAVIFSAAMSSTSGELNALASTTTVDFYKRMIKKEGTEKHYVNASKLFTVLWGFIAILFAVFVSLLDNLIEAVNIIGSLFYGTILGIFLSAFYLKFLKNNAVFIAALISETIVIIAYFYTDIGFLWYNVIGCLLVVVIAAIMNPLVRHQVK